jgi:hypothetical protein
MGKKARSYAELCGRTVCNTRDVQMVMIDFDIHASLLKQFMKQMNHISPAFGNLLNFGL